MLSVKIEKREVADNGDIMVGTFKYDQAKRTGEMMMDIHDPSKNKRHKTRDDSGSFSIPIREEGVYQICFFNSGQYERSVTLEVNEQLKQESVLMKEGQIEPIQALFKEIIKAAKHLSSDIEHQKQQEWDMRELNERTNSRVITFSMFSIGAFLALGWWKTHHLKRFFNKKKLI